jgi:TRAP-type uncharacterized transport system substrate-binding protein
MIGVHSRTRYMVASFILLIILGLIWQVGYSLPPDTIVIAAGPKGGFYDTTSLEIQRQLEAKGFKVEILNYTETEKIITDVNDPDSRVSMGFLIQKVEAAAYKNVMSLGSIMKSPLFIFQRSGLALKSPSDFKGLKIGVSPPNSSSRGISEMVLSSYGIFSDNSEFVPLSLTDMQRAIETGSIDVGFFLQPATNSVIAGIGERGIATLVQTEYAESITKKNGHLSVVTLPKGSFSIVNNLPATDIKMVAAPVTVVAKKNLHVAVVTAVALALKEIVAPPTLVSLPGEFPSMDIERNFQDSSRAADIYKSGTANEPFLYKHFSFVVAGTFDALTLTLGVLLSLPVVLSGLFEPLKLWTNQKPQRQLQTLEGLHALAQTRTLTERELAKVEKIEEYFEKNHNTVERGKRYAREIKKLHLTANSV